MQLVEVRAARTLHQVRDQLGIKTNALHSPKVAAQRLLTRLMDGQVTDGSPRREVTLNA